MERFGQGEYGAAANIIPMFTFNGQQLRGVKIEGEPWFVAKDACACLGLGVHNTAAHLSKLDSDEKGLNPINTLGGRQKMMTISRPGLFKLIQRSNKPEAKEFDRWVRHEVLPQVMDNGAYVMADADMEKATANWPALSGRDYRRIYL